MFIGTAAKVFDRASLCQARQTPSCPGPLQSPGHQQPHGSSVIADASGNWGKAFSSRQLQPNLGYELESPKEGSLCLSTG